MPVFLEPRLEAGNGVVRTVVYTGLWMDWIDVEGY
jgi:hypothetical protein